MTNINFKDLTEEQQDYYILRVMSSQVQCYVKMYNKMKKAGLTALEIIKLRGIPASYIETKNLLECGKIIIRKINDKEIEIIRPKDMK